MLKYLLGIVLGMAIVLTGAFIVSQKNDADVNMNNISEYISDFDSSSEDDQEINADKDPDLIKRAPLFENIHAATFNDEPEEEIEKKQPQNEIFTEHDGHDEPDENYDDVIETATMGWVYSKAFNRRKQAETFAEMMSSESYIVLEVFDMGFAKYMVGFKLTPDQSLDEALEEINRRKDKPNPLIMLKEDFQLLENN